MAELASEVLGALLCGSRTRERDATAGAGRAGVSQKAVPAEQGVRAGTYDVWGLRLIPESTALSDMLDRCASAGVRRATRYLCTRPARGA